MARVFSNPQLRGGEPCIKGTRIPVSMIVASMAEGMSRREILDEYPQLQDEDITAALLYASESVHQESTLHLRLAGANPSR
ncbi:MAG: antitoxin [Deltaproteobacteria bacterium HGW-Deltaproteobacteria-21]|nr:MAG: antitoxin [Deltaproteobacteria bacterium HGW-Deltaproteobacteria-21]